MSRLKRFNAQEAVDYGIVDKIFRPRKMRPDAEAVRKAKASK